MNTCVDLGTIWADAPLRSGHWHKKIEFRFAKHLRLRLLKHFKFEAQAAPDTVVSK